ncbi:ribonuclease R [Candidatus Kaiserbacteria bacterium]|nr:ribonuclease R [Candidatus Kaiserbacteria bacterium]
MDENIGAPDAHRGVIAIRGSKGTGFVKIPDREEDVMIPPEAVGLALDGDVVEITLDPGLTKTDKGERQTGRVVRVVERARSEYIGEVEMRGVTYRLRPDNRHLHWQFLLTNAGPEHLGMKVAAALDDAGWTDPAASPAADIIEVLGKAGEHETEMRAIIRSGGFATGFPPEVDQAAKALHENQAKIFAEALADPKRKDFRGVPTCTIDPADAKDFDDALSFRALPNGNYEIGIHIADVSYYVREGDPIDAQAQERGTSIYLVDRVIPMLPEVLSNDLCSLRPDEDRLAFSAVFEMTPQGAVVSEWYGQTVIHSDKRFTYQEAQEVFETGNGPLAAELKTLMEVSRILRKIRYIDGAIAFEQPEVKFELDENKKPIAVYVKERIETMLMIEDFMLLANRKVAEHIYNLRKNGNRDAAFVYRVHDAPKPEKIEDLAIFLHALGYEFRSEGGIVEATDINKLLKEVEGKPEENLIKTATIRSMAKAVYTTKNIGHFGLAFKFYTHFTSPIRRYPDLMVHRLLRMHLDGQPIASDERAHYEHLAIQSSEQEMKAVSAERESIKFKQVEYMADKVGREFDGVITGVSEYGMYVEEKESKAEGMVKLISIKGDTFTHDPKNYQVKGDRSGKKYQLGDPIRIRLASANLHDRQLDFVLV